jgi:hypothetical protein
MRQITIEWEGPFTIKHVLKLTDRQKDYGLYQIYGPHPVYGPDSLLYIGRTDTSFSNRIEGHLKPLEGIMSEDEPENLKVRIGRIVNIDGSNTPSDWKNLKRVLRDAERIQIYRHTPAYNSHHIADWQIPHDGQVLSVENTGCHGKLVKTLTSSLEWLPDRHPSCVHVQGLHSRKQ